MTQVRFLWTVVGVLSFLDFSQLPMVVWFGGAAALSLAAIRALSLFHAMKPLLMRRDVTGHKHSRLWYRLE